MFNVSKIDNSASDARRKHHRRSVRLKEYDYSKAGAYFVTICVHGRKCIFSEIRNEQMLLTRFGQIAKNCWIKIPGQFQDAKLDEFVIMPNHIHGILILDVGARFLVPEKTGFDKSNPCIANNPMILNQITLGKVIRLFKAKVAHQIRNFANFPRFKWQRNYYEHIVRNEAELNGIREYIINNLSQWQYDRENPKHIQDRAYKKRWSLVEGIIYGKKA